MKTPRLILFQVVIVTRAVSSRGGRPPGPEPEAPAERDFGAGGDQHEEPGAYRLRHHLGWRLDT